MGKSNNFLINGAWEVSPLKSLVMKLSLFWHHTWYVLGQLWEFMVEIIFTQNFKGIGSWFFNFWFQLLRDLMTVLISYKYPALCFSPPSLLPQASVTEISQSRTLKWHFPSIVCVMGTQKVDSRGSWVGAHGNALICLCNSSVHLKLIPNWEFIFKKCLWRE